MNLESSYDSVIFKCSSCSRHFTMKVTTNVTDVIKGVGECGCPFCGIDENEKVKKQVVLVELRPKGSDVDIKAALDGLIRSVDF